MFDLITVLTRSRALRLAAEIRSIDPEDAEAEYRARTAFVELAAGMDLMVHGERPSRWHGLAVEARRLEASAHLLANTREATFLQVGMIQSLTLQFGVVAGLLGYAVEPLARTHDDAARSRVEGEQIVREAAE